MLRATPGRCLDWARRGRRGICRRNKLAAVSRDQFDSVLLNDSEEPKGRAAGSFLATLPI